MNEQWQELKETIIEMRDNDGTGTQQEVCKFLANYMNILEKQMQENMGHWILFMPRGSEEWAYKCSKCAFYKYRKIIDLSKFNYCPNCRAKMQEENEE